MSVENLMWMILGFGMGVTIVALSAACWLYDIFKDEVFGADEHEDHYNAIADDIAHQLAQEMSKRPNRS